MTRLHDNEVADTSLANRLRSEVSMMIQRSLKGLEYLSTPAPAVGMTPKTLLHRRGTLSLYHYHATSDEIYRVPLLLVMATTNKAAIFDLAKGQSLIEFLLARGYDVYVMDWNAPTREEAHLTLEHYVLDFIPDCIARVQKDSGVEDITLIGYCMGGVLATLYAALHPGGPLKNLVCFTTPIDWTKMPLVGHRHFKAERLIDATGIVPAQTVVKVIETHRPAGRIAGKVRLWDNMWNDDYVKGYRRMASFGSETLPLPGAYFRQVSQQLAQRNGLYEGTLRIGGKAVDLKKIEVPLLHVIAKYDSLVPPECAQPLVAGVGSRDKEELMLAGGHVSLVAGPAAVKRMWPRLDQWLGGRSL
ncbi:Poly(3-hydroxyalkanoate) polymerase subunit PhaC [Pseudomonas fluorescens]|uniref:Poly(3-hydroxyalkanoate) polymerase subunit PhaC n=1 Tax=Pseudomonas fluorescens TaxID=294 RepID=A0A5E7N919_PSEFL|nr:alpha/beta fold hydrolase [Pseudomonas fluorescens]VVM96727.1 Poly(3-hydroxyalkanoate) polymerase subunit PhaC [Pseudomonas fluorescens]VVP33565.1 Poly(3-hydroxyalkanoate) polymerase subunit PhaC [Pseudomonas fluorescens]